MDALEQRLTADLTDAAEAATSAGLTPPDREAITAGVAARRRGRRARIGVAIAACVLAVAGAVAALAGDDLTRTEMAPPAGQGTESPGTTGTSSATTATTTTTEPTDPTTPGSSVPGPDSTTSTTPNDPEQPEQGGPAILPITEEVMLSIGYPFDQGVENLPAPCRDYWQTTGFTPEGNGLSPDQNGIVIDEATITLADIDGDGVDDGMATYICETGGVLAPGGVVAAVAELGEGDRFYAIYLDTGTLSDRHEQQFGDPRTRLTGPFALVGEPGGLREITVELDSYRQTDPNAGASARAIARYRLTGNTLELVDLQQI